MGIESIARTTPAVQFRSTRRSSAQPDENVSEAEANQKKLDYEQKKAAEDLKRKQQQIQERKEREQELDMLEKQLEASKKEAEAMEDTFKTFSKCMTIASRIAKGDIVPAKDLKFLAEHEPDLYKQAIMLRTPNPKPKKHKSLVDDEDENTEQTQGSGESESAESGEAAEVTEAAPTDGEDAAANEE